MTEKLTDGELEALEKWLGPITKRYCEHCSLTFGDLRLLIAELKAYRAETR